MVTAVQNAPSSGQTIQQMRHPPHVADRRPHVTIRGLSKRFDNTVIYDKFDLDTAGVTYSNVRIENNIAPRLDYSESPAFNPISGVITACLERGKIV